MAEDEGELMWKTVAADPSVANKLAMADWLDERDQDRDLVEGLRWCAANDKWPARWPHNGRGYFWTSEDYPRATIPANGITHIIPGHIFVWFNFNEIGQPILYRGWYCPVLQVLVRRIGIYLRRVTGGDKLNVSAPLVDQKIHAIIGNTD